MHLPNPPFNHPPGVYDAIAREHQNDPVQMAERLLACGWKLVDAARAAVNWDLRTLAAAVANERAKREMKPPGLSDDDLDRLRAKIDAAQKPPQTPNPKRTTRIMRTTPRLPQQPPKRADEPEA